MNYTALINLQFLHSYYSSGRCPDFKVSPTDACEKILKGHQILLKETATDITLLAPLDESDQAFLPFADTTTLSFIITRQNNNFSSFTTLSTVPADACRLYHNRGLSGSGVLELTQAEQTPVPGYFNRQKQAFALLELECEANAGTITAKEYSISFTPGQTIWNYYLLTEADDNKNYRIDDQAGPLSFTKVELSDNPDPSDHIAVLLEEQYADAKRYRFRSDTGVPFSEEAIRNIRLREGNKTLIDHLSNPAPNFGKPMIINMLS